LTSHIPEEDKYYEEYAPEFTLQVAAGHNVKDENGDKEYEKVEERLRRVADLWRVRRK
jgi:hypothetical protein